MGSLGDSLGRAFDKVVGAFADRVADALAARIKPAEPPPAASPAAAAPVPPPRAEPQ
ncbi:MAG: hypothetical protein FD126_1798, partial [Elusimicrobia bacterium]